MPPPKHIQTAQKARNSLLAAYIEFADGNDPQKASHHLWQAATQAITAVAQHRNWPHQTPESLHQAVTRLANELNDPLLPLQFEVAHTFRANATLDFMEDFQLKDDRPDVRHLVERILSLPDLSPDAKDRDSLLDAYIEFADGNDHLKAYNKLWQAAAQALTAVAQQRNWPHQTPESQQAVVTRLANELNDPLLNSCFPAIKSFRDNADLDFMEDFQLKSALPRARYFIERILSQLEPPPNNGGKE